MSFFSSDILNGYSGFSEIISASLSSVKTNTAVPLRIFCLVSTFQKSVHAIGITLWLLRSFRSHNLLVSFCTKTFRFRALMSSIESILSTYRAEKRAKISFRRINVNIKVTNERLRMARGIYVCATSEKKLSS